MHEARAEMLVVGAGFGGVAAALAALRLGQKVTMTEETDWIGGLVTTQAVPLDEHPWIEDVGCTQAYRRFRQGLRRYYQRHYPVLPAARADTRLNPGMGTASRVSAEPRVALAVLLEMLAPYQASGQLTLLLRLRPHQVRSQGDRIEAVSFVSMDDGAAIEIQAGLVLDATELGDVLDLGGVEHGMGAESQAETGEPHAVNGPAQPLNQQAVAAGFAVDYLPGEDHTIEKPASYAEWRDYRHNPWQGPQLSWTSWNLQTRAPRTLPLFDGPTDRERGRDYWHMRRLVYRKHFAEGCFASDVVLVNWQQNDYWKRPLMGVTPQEKALAISEAKGLSLSLLYWMQTEAPRHDGGQGYPGLRLRPDIMDTQDGLAKHVYVRESRRIKAITTVREQDISAAVRGDAGQAAACADSVGVGYYRVDLHPSAVHMDFLDVPCLPFQIPLGSLLPVRVRNLLPACRNLGITHITNGAFRTHPIEWSVGEAAGALAAFCLQNKLSPHQVQADHRHLADFQWLLTQKLGVELAWPVYSTHHGSLVGSWMWPPAGMASPAPAAQNAGLVTTWP